MGTRPLSLLHGAGPGLSHVHCCLSLLLAFSARLPPLPSALSTAAEGPCRNASQITLTHCSESPPNQTTSHPSQSKPESLSPTCRSWSAWPSPYLRFYTDLFTQRTGRTWPNLRAFALLLPLPGRLSPKVRPRAPSLLIRVSAQTALKQRGLIWPPAASLHKRPHSQHAPGH